ncbi:MAG: DUF3072 domain-containing protein [Chitinophagaceae bacterium]|nr:MAG: DUF3072 domain-containing protein [Chitinophagaceae bacterium]
MANKKRNNGAPQGAPRDNSIKDPNEWTTGDEQMTGAQRSYLNTLAQEAGEDIKEDLSKAEASKKIDELQDKTGRGRDH